MPTTAADYARAWRAGGPKTDQAARKRARLEATAAAMRERHRQPGRPVVVQPERREVMRAMMHAFLTRHPGASWREMRERWGWRACWMCGAYGWCEHREPEAEWAEIAKGGAQ
jgi:hypothetical protein